MDDELLSILTRPLPKIVYPLYFASRVRKALVASISDEERLTAEVGGVDRVGDARYAVNVTDTHGTRYRVTIEVVS